MRMLFSSVRMRGKPDRIYACKKHLAHVAMRLPNQSTLMSAHMVEMEGGPSTLAWDQRCQYKGRFWKHCPEVPHAWEVRRSLD